ALGLRTRAREAAGGLVAGVGQRALGLDLGAREGLVSARVCARERLLGLGLGARERALGLRLGTREGRLGRGLGAGAHALRLGPRRLLQLLRGTLGRIDDGSYPRAGRGRGAAMLHLIDGLGHLMQVVLYRLRVKTPAHLREVLPLNAFPCE